MNFVSNVNNLDKEQIKSETKEILKEIGQLQYKMYAESKRSLLLVFQGMDASGKDGLTKDLLNYCNPVGLSVVSFKKPSVEEYKHDFLWRIHKHLPARGMIQVFIRSHYEDILVPTVEKIFPQESIDARYSLINYFEQMAEHNGTKVLKFFLNVSQEAQEKRLMERVEIPEKHWKHNDGDWETRKKFDQYMGVYQTIFEKCNAIPWHNIPSDTNWQKLYFTAKIVLETLQKMDLRWPELETTIFNK